MFNTHTHICKFSFPVKKKLGRPKNDANTEWIRWVKKKFVRHNNQREKRTHRDIKTSVLNESNATSEKNRNPQNADTTIFCLLKIWIEKK